MKKPRKHADLIKAWADGAEIEVRMANRWVLAINPAFDEKMEYRIKPTSTIPDSWEDLEVCEGYWVDERSKVRQFKGVPSNAHKCTFPTKELAEASVAQAQLIQLRNKTWENLGGWEDKVGDYSYHIIRLKNGDFETNNQQYIDSWLKFPTEEIAREFLEKHRTLIEQAAPLL